MDFQGIFADIVEVGQMEVRIAAEDFYSEKDLTDSSWRILLQNDKKAKIKMQKSR